MNYTPGHFYIGNGSGDFKTSDSEEIIIRFRPNGDGKGAMPPSSIEAVIIERNFPESVQIAEHFRDLLNHVWRSGGFMNGETCNQKGFPYNPRPRNESDKITAKQIGMIRAMCREQGFEPDEKSKEFMKVEVSELSKKAGSRFIDWLQANERGNQRK